MKSRSNLIVSGPCLRWQPEVLDSALRAPAANDIEHGVLRGNAASPASPFVLLGLPQFAGKTFGKGDPRLPQVRPWFYSAGTHAKTSLKHRSWGRSPGQHNALPHTSQTPQLPVMAEYVCTPLAPRFASSKSLNRRFEHSSRITVDIPGRPGTPHESCLLHDGHQRRCTHAPYKTSQAAA